MRRERSRKAVLMLRYAGFEGERITWTGRLDYVDYFYVLDYNINTLRM